MCHDGIRWKAGVARFPMTPIMTEFLSKFPLFCYEARELLSSRLNWTSRGPALPSSHSPIPPSGGRPRKDAPLAIGNGKNKGPLLAIDNGDSLQEPAKNSLEGMLAIADLDEVEANYAVNDGARVV